MEWGGYSWKHGRLVSDNSADSVRTLHANLVLTGNVTELWKLQEALPGVVAGVYRAKKERRQPSKNRQWQRCSEFQMFCRRWDSLPIHQDGLLTITLVATERHPERKHVVCPFAICREFIWDTHKQAHAGVSIRCPQSYNSDGTG